MDNNSTDTAYSLTDDDLKIINAVFNLLDEIIKDHSYNFVKHIGVAEETLTKAKEETIQYHLEHLGILGIDSREIDPYKIASWYGFALSTHADDEKKIIVLAAIALLNKLLSEEDGGVILPIQMNYLLYKFACKDGGKEDNYGVGKNGIYAAFAACRCVLQQKLKNDPA